MTFLSSPKATLVSSHDRLETSLRDLSNVAQALENLVVQCDGRPDFASLEAMAVTELRRVRRAMTQRIHASR